MEWTREAYPVPDIALVSGVPEDYLETHPTAENALLVIEVSDTTLHFDQNIKASLYAQANIG